MENTATKPLLLALILVITSVVSSSKTLDVGVETMEVQQSAPTTSSRNLDRCHKSCHKDQDCIDAHCGTKCIIVKHPAINSCFK
ncbi:hypothetical protein CDL12_03801 [Handroanthus impetiginosus]|uniref:Uncharacterized protein n=1 Tax=Handroanthus impetiginosus TaxID=429701 RepID=A0A2G9I153_9LAMI|nr:hypothetical protein CDL12_03801 [Handroanthus impetiginosus]